MPSNLQIKFEDKPLTFNPGAAGNGRHQVPEDFDGARVHVEVKNGQVTAVHGERDGKPVETFIIMGTLPGTGQQPVNTMMSSRVDCYLCACSGGSCTCRPYPCPGGGD